MTVPPHSKQAQMLWKASGTLGDDLGLGYIMCLSKSASLLIPLLPRALQIIGLNPVPR